MNGYKRYGKPRPGWPLIFGTGWVWRRFTDYLHNAPGRLLKVKQCFITRFHLGDVITGLSIPNAIELKLTGSQNLGPGTRSVW